MSRIERLLTEVEAWPRRKVRFLYLLVTSAYDKREGGKLPPLELWEWREVLALTPELMDLGVTELMDLARELLKLLWKREGVA